MKMNFSEFLEKAKRFVLSHIKIVIPAVVILAVALIVVVVVNTKGGTPVTDQDPQSVDAQPISTTDVVEDVPEVIEAPLTENANEQVKALFEAYYGCLSNGDMDTLTTLCDVSETKDLLRFSEYSQYLAYSIKEIYTQAGPEEGSYIAYVHCGVTFDAYPDIPIPAYDGYFVRQKGDGSYYICQSDLTAEQNEYISTVSSFDEVVNLNNTINAEYNDLVVEHPEILSYISELDAVVNTAVGEKLAASNSEGDTTEGGETGEGGEEGGEGTGTEPTGPVYVSTTTKVNVRASDSEKADKLGQVEAGTNLELIEKLSNGWSKVKYGGMEGYIKSEYLSLMESADGVTIIGTVKTVDTVNVRATPSTDGEKLAVLQAGETLSLVSRENGWCKIVYGSRIAYVKEDFVE